MRTALRRTLSVSALAGLVAFAYWPGLRGFWGRDDFMQLAYARLVGSPWPLFVHDHYFPVPGSIFRPLGFASFWLWQALFGTDYTAHAFADMLLHVAVSVALYRVVRVSGLDRVPAVLCTLLFALHPTVLGPALWWSARFDLLAALFAFIALRAALDYLDRQRLSLLLVALTATLAALLSKETAAALVVAVSLVWLHWAWTENANRAIALRALAALWLVAIVFFAWRWAVLGTAASGLAGDMPLPTAIGKGVADWASHLSGYLSFWPRLGGAQRAIAALVAISLVVVAIAAALSGRTSEPQESRRLDVLVCGLCVFALPALLQAPVVALNAMPLRGDVSAVEVAMQSRLYYFSIGGAVIVLSVLIRHVLRSQNAALRLALVCTLGMGALVLGWASREMASAYAIRSSEPRGIAEAAVAAVDRLELPPTRCHVFLLGVEPPDEWSIYVSMDSIVKALSVDLKRVDRCFIHADHATYFHLMGAATDPADALPYQPREVHGRVLPWLEVGDAVVAYLDPPARIDPDDLAGMMFLRYENAAFRDVTPEVAAGRMRVDLR
jgi:hypothetical protein